MGTACCVCVTERKGACVRGFGGGGPVRKSPRGRPRHRWEKILKCFFRKWDGEAWTGLVCLEIGIGLGLLLLL